MDAPETDWFVRLVLDALARDEPVDPQALRVLLRRYAATGDDTLGDAIGLALARALEPVPPDRTGGGSGDPATLLTLIVEAASLSDDERLRAAAGSLARDLQAGWPSEEPAAASLPGVEACLRSLGVVDIPGLAAAAIDELERAVRVGYRPGAGMSGGGADPSAGSLVEHVVTAHALLTAFDVAGRLPYAMLADDLMQFARRRWWDGERGGYEDPAGHDDRLSWFAANCEAARALCRIAGLHADPDYTNTAVIAENCDHAADARRVFLRLEPLAQGYGLAAAVYSLALDEAGTLL